ncbi:TONSOKU isoform X1 [Olea europaea subsp. europaea]|uniref:TONSOKU isoform X1 n=1 Tax=Olea europaea subsp. europaea TaxID=158383 RepID=A0A8S0T080_OLEEU|nr:TONSOKU isoform X1 [Olea europaea subsp. europaea]
MCQSLGKVYLCLQHYRDALIYQKKHVEHAKDADDLIEQQRASTQLGRTYHDMFLSYGDQNSVRNAKKYWRCFGFRW